MVDQMKCTNCGGINISTRSVTVHRKSGKEVLGTKLLVLVVGGLLALCGVCVLLGAVVALVTPDSAASPWEMLPGGILLSLGPAAILIDYLRADKVKLFKYKCVECGHQWEQREEGAENPVQCLNCAKFDVMTQAVTVDPKTGKKIWWLLNVFGGGLLVLIGIVMIGLAIANWGFMTLEALATGGTALSLGVPLIYKYYTGHKLLKHKCASCGHQWEQHEGEENVMAAGLDTHTDGE